MTPGRPRHRIVVALDRTEYSEIVLEHAIDQAARHDDTDLHFVTVCGRHADLDAVKRELAALVLDSLDELGAGDWHARLHVRVGEPAEEIADLAAEIQALLIVVGRFGLHHTSRRVGSVASQVIDAATCPVLVVGLTDQSLSAQPQCPACMAVRAESDGERWFCAEHTAPDRERLTVFVDGPTWSGGDLR